MCINISSTWNNQCCCGQSRFIVYRKFLIWVHEVTLLPEKIYQHKFETGTLKFQWRLLIATHRSVTFIISIFLIYISLLQNEIHILHNKSMVMFFSLKCKINYGNITLKASNIFLSTFNTIIFTYNINNVNILPRMLTLLCCM